MLASGASEIVRALEAGMRPAGPVIVACHGEFDWDNAIVKADPAKRYDWAWAEALPSVIVMIGNDTKLGTIVRDIFHARPNQLDVVNHESKHAWMVLAVRPKLKTFAWFPSEVEDWLGDQVLFTRRDEMLAACGRSIA